MFFKETFQLPLSRRAWEDMCVRIRTHMDEPHLTRQSVTA